MYNYDILAITNRKLCKNNFLTQINNICELNSKKITKSLKIVLREKDLKKDDYKYLASKVIKICNKHETECILHKFYEAALELNCSKIHLPLSLLKNDESIINNFETVGVSIHSLEEALYCNKIGAKYITAGHIFKTKCKEEIPPRGLNFLEDICTNVKIPVYAIGGVTIENSSDVIKKGAKGICMMSPFMNLNTPIDLFNKFDK